MSEENNEIENESETTESQSMLGGEVTLEEGEYFLSDGVKGVGEKPEWYNSDKFKSVSEQAKGHSELHKAFGSFTGAPKDGYTLPEGIESEDALAAEYIKLATDMNMNQDGFDKGLKLLQSQSDVNEEVTREAEMLKLGDNADRRIQNLDAALKHKLGDAYGAVSEMVVDANSIMLAESLIKAYAPMKLPIEGGEHPQGITWSDIEVEMNKKDENGRLLRSSDQAHNAKVERMMKEYGGNKTTRLVVG